MADCHISVPDLIRTAGSLKTDLHLCFIFADLAITELGLHDREAGRAHTGEGRTRILHQQHFLSNVHDEGQHQAREQGLTNFGRDSMLSRVRFVQRLNSDQTWPAPHLWDTPLSLLP
jgi:hypothetical protein